MHVEIYTEDVTTLPGDMMHVRSFIKDIYISSLFFKLPGYKKVTQRYVVTCERKKMTTCLSDMGEVR
jgi:hypothetical protein